jgi:hypothetical protein
LVPNSLVVAEFGREGEDGKAGGCWDSEAERRTTLGAGSRVVWREGEVGKRPVVPDGEGKDGADSKR